MKKTKHLILFIFLLFVLRSYSQSYTVYPIPQKMTMGNQTVELSPVFNVIIEDDIHTTTIDRLREVVENAGFTMSVNEAGTASSVQTNIWLGVNGSGKAADRASSLFWAMIKNRPITVWRHWSRCLNRWRKIS